MREFIKDLYQKTYPDLKLVPFRLKTFLNNHPEIHEFCEQYLIEHQEFESLVKCLKAFLIDIFPKQCIFCRKND